MTLDTYADLFDEDLEAVAEQLDEIAHRVGNVADAKRAILMSLLRRPYLLRSWRC